jgi:hypothetical protein
VSEHINSALKASPKWLKMSAKVIRKWHQVQLMAKTTLPAHCRCPNHVCPEIP